MCTSASVVVVSVNYKNADVTLGCLNALLQLKEMPHSIIIVDNASGADDVAILREGWSRLAAHFERKAPFCCQEEDVFPVEGDVLLLLKSNEGFSAGNNAALRRIYTSRPECTAFWLLNNDTLPMPEALMALCARAEDCELVGSALVYAAEPETVQCAAGGTVSPYTGASHFVAGGENIEKVLTSSVKDVENRLDYINGASLLIRRKVFERIGFLPEEYFLYYEDVDFCTAAKRAGFHLGWAQQSIVPHMEGASSGTNRQGQQKNIPKQPAVEYYSLRNRLYFIKKFYPCLLCTALAGMLATLCLRIYRRHWANIKIVFRATFDALIGNMRIFNVV